MKFNKKALTGIMASLAMLVLILDSRTALESGSAAIDLCLKTVVPSLFPFFILSILMTDTLKSLRFTFFQPLTSLLGIPRGMEHILLIGLLGGYPVGAQCISQSYSLNQISKADARRMLGFCSNAGPAFLFGMMGKFFSNPVIPAVLWVIHIASAIIVGMILPMGNHTTAMKTSSVKSTVNALPRAIRIMSEVCGWVILFRIILSFLNQWIFKYFPIEVQVLVSGIAELTNGCLLLDQIKNEGVRFLYSSLFLGLGGICVGMQTWSVARNSNLDTGLYFPGKLMQACFSVGLSVLAVPLLFPQSSGAVWEGIVLFIPLLVISATALTIGIRKNNSSIPIQSGV